MTETLILVDERDQQIGTGEKMEVHRLGLLHRAFSLLIFDASGRLLLQRRALGKYHSPGKWTNTCCSHPRSMETLESAIHRRLVEEMGFDTALTQKTELIYHVPLDQGLTEHEYLHVYTGVYEHDPKPNPDEVMEWKWISIGTLRDDIRENPDTYTKWFAIIVNEHFEEVFA